MNGGVYMECLQKQNSNLIKGLMAVLVVAHHLYQYSHVIDTPIMSYIFASLGYLAVAVFFFYSGYGLMESYKNRGGI